MPLEGFELVDWSPLWIGRAVWLESVVEDAEEVIVGDRVV